MDPVLATRTIEAAAPRKLRLAELLLALGADGARAEPSQAHVTVGALVDHAAESGFGFLIGILALITIPFVGLSTPFGLAIALVGAQMVLGRVTPWLPRRARRRALPIHLLDRVVAILARRTRWLARSTRRRWEVAIRTRLIGLGIVILGLGLALPIPIPGSNLMFLIPLAIYAVGLLERDGVWIVVGHLGVVASTALLVAFSATAFVVIDRLRTC